MPVPAHCLIVHIRPPFVSIGSGIVLAGDRYVPITTDDEAQRTGAGPSGTRRHTEKLYALPCRLRQETRRSAQRIHIAYMLLSLHEVHA